MRQVLLLLSLLGLSSCFPYSKKFDLQPSTSAPIQEAISSIKNTDYFAFGPDWIESDWWNRFEQSELNRLINQGLENNPQLKSLKANSRKLEQESYIYRSKLFPQISAAFGFLWKHFSKNVESVIHSDAPINRLLTTLDFNFSYEVDFWAKNYNTFKASHSLYEASLFAIKEAELILSLAVAYAYFDLQASSIKKELVEQKLFNTRHLFDLTRYRAIEKLDELIEVNLSEEAVLTLEKELLELDNHIATVIHDIQALTGAGFNNDLFVSKIWKIPELKFTLPESIESNLLLQRPDLRAQIWQIQSLSHEVGAAQAEFLPNVDLMALGGLQTYTIENLFSKGSMIGSLLPLFRLPIYLGGKLKANLKAKIAAYESAVYHYEELVLNASKEFSDQLVFYQSIREQLDKQIIIVERSITNYELETARFNHGVSSQLDVILMHLKLLDQQIDTIDIEHACYVSTLGLIRALGGGFVNAR